MARNWAWVSVTPQSLSLDPGRFSFSWPMAVDEESLRRSFERFGLLRPILCIEEGRGLTVASGYRRVIHLLEQDAEQVAVRVLRHASRTELWDLLLEDHLDHRPLNPVEIGLYARRRMADTGEAPEALVDSVLPRLGLPRKVACLDDPLWVSGLPGRHRDAFAEGRLPAHGARLLARAERDDALAILDLLAGSEVGVNKFADLARWILECAWAEGKQVRSWLGEQGLPDLAGQPEELRRALRKRRFPRVAEWEESYEKDVGRARLPRNVRVEHPKGFEGGWLACTAVFSDLEELGRSISEVQRILGSGGLEPLKRYLG